VYLPEYFDRVQKAESSERLKRYHCTPEQAAELASKAKVKKLIFNHIISADGAEEIVRRARKVFTGEVIAGKDLMRF
jgi:ribonuclease Z